MWRFYAGLWKNLKLMFLRNQDVERLTSQMVRGFQLNDRHGKPSTWRTTDMANHRHGRPPTWRTTLFEPQVHPN